MPAHEIARAMADLPEVDAPGWARHIAEADELFRPDIPEDP